MKKLIIASIFALSSTAAIAAETVDSLANKISSAAAAALSIGSAVAPVVSSTIETSGASPVVVAGAITRLLAMCPSGETAAALRAQSGSNSAPAFCTADGQDALRSARGIALAQTGGGATGGTGGGGGGGGLPSAPASGGGGGGSDYRPVRT